MTRASPTCEGHAASKSSPSLRDIEYIFQIDRTIIANQYPQNKRKEGNITSRMQTTTAQTKLKKATHPQTNGPPLSVNIPYTILAPLHALNYRIGNLRGADRGR